MGIDLWEEHVFFPSCTYVLRKPEYLKSVSDASAKYMKLARESQDMNEIYPIHITQDFSLEDSIDEFKQYVLNTAWNIFDHQGYDMSNYATIFSCIFSQEHHKHSAMEKHTHGLDSQMNAFYFLEVPENSSRFVIHDARLGKAHLDFEEKCRDKLTIASQMANFSPEPGDLYFTNSYVPHSIGRNESDKPFVFVHMNIALVRVANNPKQEAVII